MTEYNIRLNPNCASAVHTGLKFKAGDKGIKFVIAVDELDTTGTTAKIVFLRANGTSVESDIAGADGVFTYKTLGNEFAVPGKTIADVKFYAADARVSTASFIFEVSGDTMDGLGAGAGGYSDRLEQLVSEAEAAEKDLKDTEEEMATVLQNFKEQYGEIGALNPKGNWSSGTTYQIRDVVYYNGSSWICLADNTSVEPSDANLNYWMHSTDLENIINGTTPVGNAEKLNGLTAEEFVANENLFVNPDFTIGTSTNIADWATVRASITKNSDGTITITRTGAATQSAYIRKEFENGAKMFNGKTITASVEDSNGTIYVFTFTPNAAIKSKSFGNIQIFYDDTVTTFPNGNSQIAFALPANSVAQTLTIKWVKLEIGKQATPFVPPNVDIEEIKVGHYIKVYKNLTDLGLTEATATAESIVNAMADNSMLLHKLSGTATSAPIQFPYNYSTLRVTKLNSSYVVFECIGTGNSLIQYGYYNGGTTVKWSGWTTRFLPLTGGALSDNLVVQKSSYPSVRLENTGTKRHGYVQSGNGSTTTITNTNTEDNTNESTIWLYPETTDLNTILRLGVKKSGALSTYNVLHTGNSAKVTTSATAPTDTTALWYDITNKTWKRYVDGAWTA